MTSSSSQAFVNQGPLIPDLLYFQGKHRSCGVFFNAKEALAPIGCRRGDSSFWIYWADSVLQCPYTMQHIEQMGFDRVLRLGNIVLDRSLVQSLIERWRPETSTFHFSFGEATITLQDVECLLGIRTEGNAVTGSEEAPEGGWGPYIEYHLGIQRVSNNSIMFRDLEDFICLDQARLQLIDNWPLKRARVVVSYILGGLLFPDKNGNSVYCHLVRALIEDKTVELSWGSACLAVLYKNLSKAAMNPLPKSVGGCLVLLQVISTNI